VRTRDKKRDYKMQDRVKGVWQGMMDGQDEGLTAFRP